MLVITRRVGEKLIIGENVAVVVLGAKGNQIRIGVDAPRDVTVNRDEIHQRILKEQKALKSNSAGRISAPKAKTPIQIVKRSKLTLSVSDKR